MLGQRRARYSSESRNKENESVGKEKKQTMKTKTKEAYDRVIASVVNAEPV